MQLDIKNEFIANNCDPYILRFKKIKTKIVSINFSNINYKDFSVKKIRNFLLENYERKIIIPYVIKDIWKKINVNKLHQKIIIHTWKVFIGNIITSKISKNWMNEEKCYFYYEKEDIIHRYFKCFRAIFWWEILLKTFNIHSFKTEDLYFLKILGNSYTKISNFIFQITLWFLNKTYHSIVLGLLEINPYKELTLFKSLLNDIISSIIKVDKKIEQEGNKLSILNEKISLNTNKIDFHLTFH